MVRSALLAAIFAVGCSERNPAFCGDGFCTSLDLPYCDIDGTISGIPGQCIAVDCTLGGLEFCRGDIAVACNAAGDNFEDTMCPLGCDPDASGCRQCTDDAQCDEATPVCDGATSSCRICVADDECASRVCDLELGSCVPESSIVYAGPTEFGTCSLAQPCPLAEAIVAATNTTPAPLVRMLFGTYIEPLVVENPTANPLKIVGTGATIAVAGASNFSIVVSNGANVELRDLGSTSESHIRCGAENAPISTFRLERIALQGIARRAPARRSVAAISRCSTRRWSA